ncbi:MAG: serine/threonine protein kinase, partial [Coriobacteriales bacterium]|nr:serine/threonine protein kinase [Coriobacteriales bacterium]
MTDQSEQMLLGRYRRLHAAGKGGFATVEVGWDTRLQRRVAIKRISLKAYQEYQPTESQAYPGAIDLPGLQEARTAALLNDAHIVRVIDFQTTEDEAFIIMEYVDGPTLTEVLMAADELLDLDIIAALIRDIAQALICAHENQVLHLDIKPDNVLLDMSNGHAKVTDFGLAQLASSSGYSSSRGGSCGFMPPEQIDGSIVDERSDLWSFAILSYQLLTGMNPFLTRSPRSEE